MISGNNAVPAASGSDVSAPDVPESDVAETHTTEIDSTGETEVDEEAPVQSETVQVALPSYENMGSVASLSAEGTVEKEEISLELVFSGFFSVPENMERGEVLCVSEDPGENGKPMGSFTLSNREDGTIVMKALIKVPQYREDSAKGRILFFLALPEGISDYKLQWDEESGMVTGHEKEVLVRTPLQGRIVALSEPEKLPSETKTTQIDLKTSLSKVSDPRISQYAKIYKSAQMNLITARGSSKIRVEVKAELSDEYLSTGFEKLLDGYAEGTSLEEYLKDPASYANAGLMELRLPFSFGDTFSTITGSDVQTGLTLENSGSPQDDDFGFYKLEIINAGLVQMNCILQNLLYTKSGAKMEFAYELNCTKAIAANEVYTFTEKDGKISCGENLRVTVDGDPAGPGEYTIEKSVLESGRISPYVNYRIAVKAYDVGGLDGALLQDILPDIGIQGKEVQALLAGSIFVTTDREGRKEVRQGNPGEVGTYYLETDAVTGQEALHYRFAQDGTTRAVFEVEMVLTPAAMMEMNRSGGKISFANRARLTAPGDAPKVYEAGSDPVEKQFRMFEKTGKPCETDTGKMEWNISVQTVFSGRPQVWLVDTLDPAVHTYLENESISLALSAKNEDGSQTGGTANSVSLKYIPAKPSGVSDNSFAAVGVKELDAYSASAGNAKAFYYESDDGSMVMAVRIGDYLAPSGTEKKEQTLLITYLTKIKAPGPGKQDIQNRADLRWEYGGSGPGPGWTPEFDFSLDKNVEVNMGGVTKRPGKNGYDEKTMTQTWWFDINSIGSDLGEIVIEEDFTAAGSSQILPSPVECRIVHVNSTSAGSGITEGMAVAQGGTVPPYYTVENGNKLKIHLGNVAKEDNYIVELKTRVSGAITSQHNPGGMDGSIKVKNQALITDDLGNPKGDAAEAEVVVPNTLITKAAVGSYHYDTNEFYWEVSINPNSLTIRDGTIIEELPVWHQLGRLVKVRYGSDELDAGAGNLVAALPSVGNTVQSVLTIPSTALKVELTRNPDLAGAGESYGVSLTAGSGKETLDKPLVLYFTSQLNEAYRDLAFRQKDTDSAVYKDIMDDGVLSSAFTNTARLSGTILDASLAAGYGINPADVWASAVHKAETKPLEKKGLYSKDKPGRIQWSVVVNQAGGEIGGLVLTDLLSKPEQMEYNTAASSYGLFEADVAEDGTLTKGAKESAAAVTILPADGKLTVTFPPASCRKTYLLEFETYLLDDVLLADMTNQLSLEGADGSKLSSNHAVPTGASSFSSNEYAMAKDAPILMLDKFSSSEDASGNHLIKLPETEFAIREQMYDTSRWIDAPGTDKIKETNASGRKIFVNFENGKLYKVTETKAPAGYTAGNPFYIYWMKDVAEADDPTAGKAMNDALGNPILPEQIVKVSSTYFKKQPVYNDPVQGAESGKVRFVKTDYLGVPLAGAEFTLSHSKGLVAPKTKVSGADGVVEFQNVDPGTYQLKETKVPHPWMIAPAAMTVIKDGADYRILDSKNQNLAQDGGGTYLVKNELAEGSVNLRKKDQNGLLLPDTVFSVERYGDAVTPEPAGNTYVDYPVDMPAAADRPNQAVTGADGIARLGGLIYGTYRITELKGPNVHPGEKNEWFLQVACENNQPKVTWYGVIRRVLW